MQALQPEWLRKFVFDEKEEGAMGIRRLPWTEAYIAQRVREGRGLGEGSEYDPWIRVQEFSSRGTQSRIPSPLLGRGVHTMSYIERRLFLLHESLRGLLDYREQFPIPREVSLAAAKTLGIRHPLYPHTSIPLVMTFDALVWREQADGSSAACAWDAKKHADLSKPRTRDKLAIHRGAAVIMGIEHKVFTEMSVSGALIRNIEWLRHSRARQGETLAELANHEFHKAMVLVDLHERRPRATIMTYCHEYDRKGRHAPGTALRAVKQLIYERQLKVDLESEDLMALRVPLPETPFLRTPLMEEH